MKAKYPGFLPITGLFTAIISTITIGVSALASGGSMFSPGALNAIPGNILGNVTSHAEIAGNCKACHTAPWDAATMDDRCSTCHVDVAVEMKDQTSVHSKMMQIDPNAKCRTCHPEHKGPDALLTVLEGWRFPHDVARFSLKSHQLTANHGPFLCADCHGNDVTVFDQLTCLKCHINIDLEFMVNHQVTFGENCLECHDGVDHYGHNFDHNKFTFTLNGKHADVKCSQCHVMATTVSALQMTSQDCFSCHAKDDPHQGSLGTDCAACHSPDGWKPSSFDHNRSEFKLTGAHLQVACEKCHVSDVFKGTPKDCFSCHQQVDPHMGQLGTTCENCHSTDAWIPAHFDHDTTGFKLIGSHKNVDCSSCHANGVYKNTPKDCFSCHAKEDKHNGQLGANCSTCHIPSGWNNIIFDHNTSAFPLTGKHTKMACSQCHVAGQYKIPTACDSCHGEPSFHTGAFGTSCTQCHITSDWLPATFIGTHPVALGQNFLDHHGATCKTCHTNTVHEFTCLACHEANPLEPNNGTPVPTFPSTPISSETPVINEPNVFTSITPSIIAVDDVGQVTVGMNNIPAQGYTSTEFTCTYNPALVDVSDIIVGNLFGADAVSGIFGPENGSFVFAVAGSNGQKALGSGNVFTFSTKGLQAGQTTVECKARVSEGLNVLQNIPYTSSTMTIGGVVPTPTTTLTSASITGQVLASKVVTIQLYNTDNSIAAIGTTNPDGTFYLSVPGGTYTIEASADGFLSAQGSVSPVNGHTSTKSVISLIAGDIDDNGTINQIDALTIRMNYNNATPTAADLNNDGVINVLDLGILAENYGMSGALLWP